jgi:hypothetical protein
MSGSLGKVQQFLANDVVEGSLKSEARIDRFYRFALLEPNLSVLCSTIYSLRPYRLHDIYAASRSLSFDHRRRPETLRTAMATAFFCPTKTTSRLPRVTPVYSKLRCNMV